MAGATYSKEPKDWASMKGRASMIFRGDMQGVHALVLYLQMIEGRSDTGYWMVDWDMMAEIWKVKVRRLHEIKRKGISYGLLKKGKGSMLWVHPILLNEEIKTK